MELEIENKENYNQIIQKSIEKENSNNINNELNNNLDYNFSKEKQNNFLETTLGRTINTALNIGIRYLLPNIIEDQVIEIKDTIIKDGFKDGLNKTIESAMDLGKSAMGLVTGKFDNVSQMQTAIEKGGLIDTISDCIDFGLKVGKHTGIIPKEVEGIIKNGKNILMSNIESNIESTLTTQLKGIEKVNKYIDNWNTYYKEQNFSKMELEYDKIREKLKDLVPIEETLKKAHQVENLHKLIRSKGRDFNLSEEEIELAKKLS
ncbi:MAG: hypothetical protein HFJ58_05940 [Clostridia bacterium]|nr:hypothetical protein [Clostridia bacterium]